MDFHRLPNDQRLTDDVNGRGTLFRLPAFGSHQRGDRLFEPGSFLLVAGRLKSGDDLVGVRLNRHFCLLGPGDMSPQSTE